MVQNRNKLIELFIGNASNCIIHKTAGFHLSVMSGSSEIRCAQKPCIMSEIPGVKNHLHIHALQNMLLISDEWFLTYLKKQLKKIT